MTKIRKSLALLLACLCIVFVIPPEAFAENCPHMSEEACPICEVETLIDTLPALEDMNGTYLDQLTETQNAYDALDEEHRALVSNADKLIEIQTAFTSSEEDVSTAAVLGGLEPLLPSCTHGTAFTKTSGNVSAGNYYLTSNRTLSGMITVSSGTVNLCLNGYTLSGRNSFKMSQITDGATLNIYDCKGTGKITGGYQDDMYAPSGCLEAVGGYINMYGGTITGNTADQGGAVAVSAGEFNMYSGAITGNTAENGGGIYVSGGSCTIYGGTVTGNTATKGGGAYTWMGGSLYMEGGTISGNTASENGGGVYKDGGTLRLTYSPTISGNTVNGRPNNVYLYQNQTLRVDTYLGFYPSTPIGITTMVAPTSSSPVNVTNNTGGDYSYYFSSDNSNYAVRNNSGTVQLYVPTYRYVYYLANGGSGSMGTTTLTDGQVAFILENAFTRSGYRFTGWNTAANGSGTNYSPGAILDPLSSITLYAQWEPDTYTLSFNANGGSGSMSSRSVSSGTSVQIPSNSYTRSKYTFAGWNTRADGTGTSYSDRSYISISSNTTLYAQWTAITDYTVVLPDGGDLIVDPNTRTGSAGIGIQAGSIIPDGKSLQMAVNAGTHYSRGYRLQNQTGGQFTAYDLTYKGNPIDPGNTNGKSVLETASSDSAFNGFENDIAVAVDTPIASGVYTDTLTFSFSLI